jgi:hypothetical protein
MAAPAVPSLLLVHCVGCAVAGVDCVDQPVSWFPGVFARILLTRFFSPTAPAPVLLAARARSPVPTCKWLLFRGPLVEKRR